MDHIITLQKCQKTHICTPPVPQNESLFKKQNEHDILTDGSAVRWFFVHLKFASFFEKKETMVPKY